MSRVDIRQVLAQSGGAALIVMAALAALVASRPAAAFGGVGSLGECTSFTACTAVLGSSTAAFSQYRFSNIAQFYPLPVTLNPAVNGVSLTDRLDTNAVVSTAPSAAAVGGFCINCASDNPFYSSASAHAQSDFGLNRAVAASGFGAAGSDDRGNGVSATVSVTTGAQAQSAWRDAWSFAGDGHFSATVRLDGVSSNDITNALFPSTYLHSGVGTAGDWFFDLKVWDVDHLSISDDFEVTPGPTLVTRVQDRSGINNEQRPSFASSLPLDFDFFSGVHYVVTVELGVQARNGRRIDLYNTARLQDVALTGGATLTALSGHDYLAPVPEPQPAVLLAAGMLALALWSRRRSARA